jgi:hypothetical protein
METSSYIRSRRKDCNSLHNDGGMGRILSRGVVPKDRHPLEKQKKWNRSNFEIQKNADKMDDIRSVPHFLINGGKNSYSLR